MAQTGTSKPKYLLVQVALLKKAVEASIRSLKPQETQEACEEFAKVATACWQEFNDYAMKTKVREDKNED